MPKEHTYKTSLDWVGNTGEGTKSYAAYERLYQIKVDGKLPYTGSADPNFKGDPSKYNPEEMLVMSLSSCHMLWYLHLCSVNEIVVENYKDVAIGIMSENPDGSGEFKEVTLNPKVIISSGDVNKAKDLHQQANQLCFIARSMNFPVNHDVQIS